MDLFQLFVENFLKGDFFKATQLILPHPDIDYDTLHSAEPSFRRLVNYVDASLFGTLPAAYFANMCLHDELSADPTQATRYADLIDLLNFERNIIALSADESIRFLLDPSLTPPIKAYLQNERLETFLLPSEIESIISGIPSCLRDCFQNKLSLLQGWVSFKTQKQPLAEVWLGKDFYWSHPWYPLQYYLSPQIPSLSDGDIPLIFLEPLQEGLSALIVQLENRPALFIFETKASFLQILQDPIVVNSLTSPLHLIYILDTYPHKQFLLQPRDLLKGASFQPIVILKRQGIDDTLAAFLEALVAYCNQPNSALDADNELGDWLYQVAKSLSLSHEIKRLGVSRAAGFLNRLPHKYPYHHGLPAPDRHLGDLIPDYFGIQLDKLSQEKPRRMMSSTTKKRKLAHIMPHLVDTTVHAPSRIVENLIVHHDREAFDLYLILTELTQFHPLEYPLNFFSCPSSRMTAPQRLRLFEQEGVSIHSLEQPTLYEQDAKWVSDLLHELEIDIAVFHGADIVNFMCAKLTDAPLRVFFEHGGPPSFPVFDLAILSSPIDLYQKQLEQLHIRAFFLPFAMEVKSSWEGKEEITKEALGFPSESVIMTTISNNLGIRLSDEMCDAIAQILEQVPHAYYAPIGSREDTAKFERFFKDRGVGERVVFLGYRDNPSLYAKCMDLYLNEFPIGSGVALLDALACGCPVVSMYDERGTQPRRYGGILFGIDRCISSGKKEDYISLACRLLTDPKLYEEWSLHATQQYEALSNPKAYTKAFENFLRLPLGGVA